MTDNILYTLIGAIVRLAEANPVIGFGLLIGIVCLGLAEVEPL